MSVAVQSPSRHPPADDELQRSLSNLTLSTSSSSLAADAEPSSRIAAALLSASSTSAPVTAPLTSSKPSNSTPPPIAASASPSTVPVASIPSSSALSSFSASSSSNSSSASSTSSSSSSSSLSSPLYVPPPSSALPSSSPYLPSTLRAPPGQTLTVEGEDNRRHTYNDAGVELGNDPLTGYYEEVEIEDMEWEADERRWTYPCPCGDKFVLSVDELMDGECIGRCPSCSLVIKVIYDPEDVFEQEGDSDDD